ncbi:general secretion pathway protein D [Desulfosarcina sp. BuS5]|uniref:type II secretion system secretin GspD n=1 Tax=Desulfosarcina sp. BuS5 TaxID=933262 RepID=UPI0004804F28|nr:type II secretion system secretin GspD [Desulfosarcina sp. BuS5]WDN90297.1 general secretion pathway protein D [Desulfosarcina sp. BuS5]
MNNYSKKNRIFKLIFLLAAVAVVILCQALTTFAEPAESLQNHPALKLIRGKGEPILSNDADDAVTAAENDSPGNDKGIVFNFDDADIFEVIKSFGELLGINYVVDPSISGTVTIHISEKLNKKDLLPVFFKILEINGLAAVKESGIYQITTADNIPRKLISKEKGIKKQDILLKGDMLIQVIPVKYVTAAEVEKIVQPFLSAAGSIFSHDPTNILLVVDRLANIKKILMITDVFDVDVFKKLNFKLYPIKNVDAKDLSKNLDDAFSASYMKSKDTGIKFIVIDHLNAILAVSSKPDVFATVDEFINAIDTDSPDVEPRIYVYAVQNGAAENLHDLLEEIFNKKERTKTEKNGADNEPEKKTAPRKPLKTNIEKTGSGSLKGEIYITADETRNALIIEAIPSDYKIIKNLLEKLDVLPRQVLIECMVAEVQLGDGLELGIDWSYSTLRSESSKGMGGTETAIDVAAGAAGIKQGLKYVIEKSDKLVMTLHTLAEDNKVNVLSTPSVLASDNKEAKIEITTEQPISTAEYTHTGDSDVIETSIEYRDTGIILTVMPHINERGLVTMDVKQEVSEVMEDYVTVGSGGSYPVFFKRAAETTLTVQNKQTIVIGGLIRQKRDRVRRGIPFLVNIPVLGFIFGYTKDEISKTELMIVLTPTVIINSDDVDHVTKEFKQKLGKLKEELKGTEQFQE